MPLLNSAKSLSRLCLDNIKTCFESSNDSVADFLKIQNFKKQSEKCIIAEDIEIGDNPFHYLPTVLLEEIIKVLSHDLKKPMMKTILEHLITPQITTLKLSYYEEDYLKHFPKFRKLEKLNISLNSSLGDSCFKLIGTYCKSLRELNASGCHGMTDSAIQWLCVEAKNQRMENETLGQCKRIEKLRITCTQVTVKGVQLALKHLPALKILHHEATVTALANMTTFSYKNAQVFRKYPLLALFIALGTPYTSGSLNQAVSMCPRIDNIRICANNEGLTDNDLFCLKSIQTLRELAIFLVPNVKENLKFTFGGGVAPLLELVGNSLEKLNLSVFDADDVWIITEFCPNLRSLILLKNLKSTAISSQEEKINHQFQTERSRKKGPILKKLVYLCIGYLNFPFDILIYLLSFPSLLDVRIHHCATLTDVVFEEVARIHQFRNLERLILICCCSITYDGIDILMVDGNSLKELRLIYCNKLSIKNFCDWTAKICQKNWSFYFYISYFYNNRPFFYSMGDDLQGKEYYC